MFKRLAVATLAAAALATGAYIQVSSAVPAADQARTGGPSPEPAQGCEHRSPAPGEPETVCAVRKP